MEWANGAGGQEYPLYNQAALESADTETVVYLVEGEKDCDTLTNNGILAISSPHRAGEGKGKWEPHHTEALRGRKVVVVPDNDDTGRGFAKTVATASHDVAASVKVVDLNSAWSGLDDGADITNIFETRGYDVAVFHVLDRLAADTQEFIPDAVPTTTVGYGPDPSKAEELLMLVDGLDMALFHDEVNDAFAAITIDGNTRVWALDDGELKMWLSKLYNNGTGKLIGDSSVKQVLSVLSARAIFDNPDPVRMSVRVAEHEQSFYYDLTNSKWQVVKITADGWAVDDNPPMLFKRYRHQQAQVMPRAGGGDVKKILHHINIKPDYHILFLCWLICCFVPEIPHAMPIFYGEKGAAKTTTCALLRRLIDPSKLETITLENDQRTLAVNLQNNWFLPFDNVSFINEHTSDTLCRAITGGGIQQRKLYTNADDHIFTFQRCLAINGINNVATRPDLLDRSILIELVRISVTERKKLADVLGAFEADRPDILGGIFDTLSAAMKIMPTVNLDGLSRMADFCGWAYAIGEALGGYGEQFLDEYTANRDIQNTEALCSDPVATLIIAFMEGRDTWHGLVSELLAQLVIIAPSHGIDPKAAATGFPKQPNGLARRLNGIKSNLEGVGITFEKRGDMRGMTIFIKNAKLSPLPPFPSYIHDYATLKGSRDGDTAEAATAPVSADMPNAKDYGGHGGYGDEIVTPDLEEVQF
jgi:hypothetical protein